METKLPKVYPMYDTVYGNEVPTEQYFVVLFDELPSKFSTALNYHPTIIDYFKSNGFVEEVNIYQSNRRLDMSSQLMLVNKEKQIIVRTSGNVIKDKDNLLHIDFTYNVLNGELSSQIDLEKIKEFERTKKKSNINLVKLEHGHMDTEEFDLYIPEMDLLLNYGETFFKIHETIVKRLNSPSDKGIILLHGDPGTGKTSYIKYLTSLIQDKDILFVPPSMAEMLSEPSIIPFLMEHKNSILIIEDAERVISDREGNGSSAGVSNILNITDGILGDCLGIQVIATFNMKREKIDQALLRKGRLIAEHKFEKLNVDETNKLLKHLEKNQEVNEGMPLADIYNIDVELIKTPNKSKLGF
jgi:hypothetical protein